VERKGPKIKQFVFALCSVITQTHPDPFGHSLEEMLDGLAAAEGGIPAPVQVAIL